MAYFIVAGFGLVLLDAVIRNPWVTLFGILLPLWGVYRLADHTLSWCMASPACPVG